MIQGSTTNTRRCTADNKHTAINNLWLSSIPNSSTRCILSHGISNLTINNTNGPRNNI